jgi:AraC-like DNA-binding protein
MNLLTFYPHIALRSFVRFYWLLEPDYHGDQLHRLLPGSGCDLIIQIGPPAVYKSGANDWAIRRPAGFVEGHFKEFFLLRFSGACRLAGIRFTCTGLYPFLKTPLKEFTQRFVDVTAVFGSCGRELIEQVAEAASTNALPRIFDKFLLQQFDHDVARDHLLEHAVQILFQKHGAMPIHLLARELGMSERQLERAFNRRVGISPERFAQTLRLNRFIRLARQPNRPSFTQLAYGCGYADQSHLIRAFKQHTGLTPREYFCQQDTLQQALNEKADEN